jgi:hypothetical protein
MSIEKDTSQPSNANFVEALTQEITDGVRQTLAKLVNEEIVCVAIVDKNNSIQVLTNTPMKILKEEPCGPGDPAFAWEKTAEGCLWMVTLENDVANGDWKKKSRKCIYDSRLPACPVGTEEG